MSNRRKNKPVPSQPAKIDQQSSNTQSEKQEIHKQQLFAAKYSGPIPPPEIFRKYGEVVPDAPERILTVFEEDSFFTRDIQYKALDAHKGGNRRTQWMAFCLVFFCVSCATFLAYAGHEKTASFIVTTTLVAIISEFLKSGRLKQQPDKEE